MNLAAVSGELIAELLTLLKDNQLDYTNTFDALTESLKGETVSYLSR